MILSLYESSNNPPAKKIKSFNLMPSLNGKTPGLCTDPFTVTVVAVSNSKILFMSSSSPALNTISAISPPKIDFRSKLMTVFLSSDSFLNSKARS